ncbi:MAG: hypothetical protein MJZ21_01875 [archaeon]|nr:hypothetical protein [archaeon]
MAEDLSWVPETLINLLKRSESHYRAVGFKRTAHHISKALAEAEKSNVNVEFYPKYVKLLKDDISDFITGMNFDRKVTDDFIGSMNQSIDAVSTLLAGLDAEGKTPTFNGSTSKPEDAASIRAFFEKYGTLYDPIRSTGNAFDALTFAIPTFEMVYNHVFTPGRAYLISQLELALGRDRTLEMVDSILSVYGIIPKGNELVSDYRYAYENPGDLSEDQKGWVLTDKVTIPVNSFARWSIFMYYKVQIITAMLPAHNVIFFAMVKNLINKRQAEGRQ